MNKLVAYFRSWGENLISSNKSFFGAQAMPSAKNVQIISSETKDEVSYIAPADGYVIVLTKYVEESGTIQLYNETANFAVQTYKKDASTRLKFFIPVRKGDLIKRQGVLTTDGLTFNYLMGGINHLIELAQAWIRGGGLCLNSSNFSKLGLLESVTRRQKDLLSIAFRHSLKEKLRLLLRYQLPGMDTFKFAHGVLLEQESITTPLKRLKETGIFLVALLCGSQIADLKSTHGFHVQKGIRFGFNCIKIWITRREVTSFFTRDWALNYVVLEVCHG